MTTLFDGWDDGAVARLAGARGVTSGSLSRYESMEPPEPRDARTTVSERSRGVALGLAIEKLHSQGKLARSTTPVLKNLIAAVSVGMVNGVPLLDLDYPEDVAADVDMNVVMSSEGRFVEVQGTGEHGTFARGDLDRLLDLAARGLREIDAAQRRALGE